MEEALAALSQTLENPALIDALLSSQRLDGPAPDVSEELSATLPILYSSLVPLLPRRPELEELITDGVDGEGLWAQVEMGTESLHRGLRKLGEKVVILEDAEDEYDDKVEEHKGSSPSPDVDSKDEESRRIRERMERAMTEIEDDALEDDDSESQDEPFRGDEQGPVNSDKDDEDRDCGDDGDPLGNPMRDGFFDVDHMEDWADEEERLHCQPVQNEKSNSASSSVGKENDFGVNDYNDGEEMLGRDEDDMRVLARLYDDEECGESEDEYNNLTAEDFFGKPDVKSMERYKQSFEKGRKGTTPSSYKSASKEGVEAASSCTEPSRQSKPTKLEQQTKELEDEALAEKPWTMMGEINSGARPVDSLLSVAPEFEQTSKLAPTISVEHTESLEEMINCRILAEDWDDVTPRELPTIDSRKCGAAVGVSQEKSKLGLGELYERDFLRKAVGYDVGMAEKETYEGLAKSEMKALFAKLCSRLDALSNYHFAPRPVADEADVKSLSTPAIAMEEVIPLTVSDAKGSAPEEIYAGKRGRDSVLKSDLELEQSERKRLRAIKKQARRREKRQKEADEKLMSRLKPGLGLNNPYEARKLREDLSKARSSGALIEGKADDHDDFNTSAKFFDRLQEQVKGELKRDGASQGKNKKEKRKANVML